MFWSSCTKLSFIKKKNLMKIKTRDRKSVV